MNKDMTGRNIWHGGRRIGAVQAGNEFVPCADLTKSDEEYLETLGLTPPAPPPAKAEPAPPELERPTEDSDT